MVSGCQSVRVSKCRKTEEHESMRRFESEVHFTLHTRQLDTLTHRHTDTLTH